MLPYAVSMVILIVVLLFLVAFFMRYTIVKVNGESMMPTLKHGRIMILDRKFNFREILIASEFVDDIFVVLPPSVGRPNIKRLISCADTHHGTYLWFEGDNKDNSLDSREYGFLEAEDVLGRVVPLKEAIFNTVGRKRT